MAGDMVHHGTYESVNPNGQSRGRLVIHVEFKAWTALPGYRVDTDTALVSTSGLINSVRVPMGVL